MAIPVSIKLVTAILKVLALAFVALLPLVNRG
jgi:hypothetical protein